MGTIKIVCGWCKKPMGTKDGDPETLPNGMVLDVTHGICPECSEKFLSGFDFEKEKGNEQGTV